jgi:hypothetical protein
VSDGSNDEGDLLHIPTRATKKDAKTEDQVNGELKDEVEHTQIKSEEEDENEDEDDDEDDGDEEVPEGESVLADASPCVPSMSLNSV